MALISSFKNRVIDPKTIVFGEVGLAGEVRAVSQADKRVQEAKKLGFHNVHNACCYQEKSYRNHWNQYNWGK